LATHAATALLLGLLLVAVAPPLEGPSIGSAEPPLCDPDRVELRIHLDESDLQRGGPRGGIAHLQIEVVGTLAPVAIELVNRTPGVVELEGGDLQVSRSSGGPENRLERELATIRSGELQVHYRLADQPCPVG